MAKNPQTPITEKPSHIPWPPIILVLLVLASLILGRIYPLPWPGLDDQPARIAGWGLLAAGVLLVIWAVRTLSVNKTTIKPHHASDHLVTTGPFALRRNPIYLGDFLILLGISVLSTNLWFAVSSLAFIPLVTWLAILPEERHLQARFGEAWQSYAEKTRRLF